MNLTQLRTEIETEEGCVLHEYKDSLGFSTIGIGRLIDGRRGGGLSPDEVDLMFSNDIIKITNQLNAEIPWWNKLTEVRQRALINMTFQLGIDGLLQFKNMLAQLKAGNYAQAVREALDSKWAKSDSPQRANRITKMLLEG